MHVSWQTYSNSYKEIKNLKISLEQTHFHMLTPKKERKETERERERFEWREPTSNVESEQMKVILIEQSNQ